MVGKVVKVVVILYVKVIFLVESMKVVVEKVSGFV